MISPAEALDAAAASADRLRQSLGEIPTVAVVLGSGWGVLLEGRDTGPSLDFIDAGQTPATARGHRGRVLVLDTAAGPLLVQDGRLHCYEGLSALEAAFPALVLAEAGARLLICLSAAGGLNPMYMPGDMMLVADHVMLWGDNPLTGLPESAERSPHVACGDLYPEHLREMLKLSLPPGARCETGVYAYVPGPSFETPTEAQLLRLAGADAVGMSTAPEVLMAKYAGMQAAAMCCISNSLLPFQSGKVSHDGVLDVVSAAAGALPEFLDRLAANAYMVI